MTVPATVTAREEEEEGAGSGEEGGHRGQH
jgi:hypothetical protein